MIKRLRRRIVLMNVVLVGLVILGIFTAVNISNYTNSVNTLEHGLNQLIERSFKPEMQFDKNAVQPNGEGEKFKFEKNGNGDRAPMQISSYIIATLDSDGNITDKQENGVTMDEDDLKVCVKTALSEDNRYGQIGEYSLMYVMREDMGVKRIAFTSNSSIYATLGNSVIISLILFVASVGVIFLISLFLSGLAVKPVKTAWEQQKQFVADASHELKTPLTVILANNNIMMSHENAAVRDERQWLESTQEEAGHMKNLIDQMLFLAKSDAGSTAVQLSEVDFSTVVEGAALNFEPVAFEKEVEIVSDIAGGVTVQGNETQLNQLVHILVDNAVKYAAEQSAVTIKLTKKGDKIELSVNNFGNTISKDDLGHIFDRFYRAEKSRTTKGYGLGLSIARRITESMHGKITVESNETDGTTFTVVMSGK